MELSRIENLLEAYFEGETSLAEEQILGDYFTSDHVAPHHEPYIPLFAAFAQARTETFKGEINLPRKRRDWSWVGIAAGVVLCIGLFLTFNNQPIQKDLGTYDDPEVAALKTKQALMMVGNFMNEGTDQLKVLSEFEKTTDKYLK